MNIKKRIILIIFIFLMLTTYKGTEFIFFEKFKDFFLIKRITLHNKSFASQKEIMNRFSNIYNKNIFFLDSKKTQNLFQNIDFVKDVSVKKIFPDKLNIEITNDRPIAQININQKNLIITESNKLILFKNLNLIQKLPLVNGLEADKNFSIFYNFLLESSFPIDTIAQYNYFQIGRWDLYLTDSRLIKLPATNYKKIINSLTKIMNDPEFEDKKVFDFRIENRIIIN